MLYMQKKIIIFKKILGSKPLLFLSIISKGIIMIQYYYLFFDHILILIPFLPLKENFMNKFLKVQIKNQNLK
jgi:hypothetical protein